MKRSRMWIGAAGLLGIALAGCQTGPEMGHWVGAFDDMGRNASLRQQTLYDHHFQPGGAELNAAGRSRLLHIVRYAHPDVPHVLVASDWERPALAQARVQHVNQTLAVMNVGGRLALSAQPLDVPVWGMSGEESVISVESMLAAFANSRANASASYDAGTADAGETDDQED